jgi:uncharacterized membrane protein
MSKPWGVIVLPLAAILVFIVMRLIPVISPKGYRMESFANVVHIFQVTVVGFMSLVAILALLAGSGVNVPLNEVIFAALGAMFMIVGRYLGKARKNFFLGIRTPWTLASDEVWGRTHRVAGRLFVLQGLIMLSGVVFAVPVWLLIGMVGVIVGVPVVYSYVVYRKVEGVGEGDGSVR